MANISPKVVNPLRQKLLRTFLPVTLVPLAALGMLGTILTYRQTTQQANIKLHERSVFAAELTHRELKDAISFLQATAINPLTQTAVKEGTAMVEAEALEQKPIDQVEAQFAVEKVLPTNAKLEAYFQEVANVGGFSELFLTEKHGFNVGYSHITSDFVQSDEAWWQSGRDKGQWIGTPEYDESSQAVTVNLVYAVKHPRTQELLGMLKGGYDAKKLSFLARDLQALRLQDSEQLQIISSGAQPQVVATVTAAGTNQERDLIVAPEILQEAILNIEKQSDNSQGNPSSIHTVSLTQGHRQYSFAQIPETDWLIIASACHYEIHAVETQWILMFGGALLGLGFISWLMVSRFSKHLTEPLSQLVEGTHQVIQKADFSLRVPETQQDEVGALARSLNQLLAWSNDHTQALNLSQQELEERTEELSTTLEELRHAQFQLVQTEKMSALGQLVAGVAHEINNPVSFIHGNLKHVEGYTQDLIDFLALYEEHYPNPADEIQAEAEALDLDFLKEDLEKTLFSMKMGTKRIREIVLSLRNFSRMDEAECKAIDIHEGLESTLLILQHRLKLQPERPAITIDRDFDKLPLVECYASHLNQVFMNILTNALDALESAHTSMEQKKLQITLRTEARTDSVVVSIANNGPVIPPEVKARIFDPFFTTKAVGQGTGMGLAISYQLITKTHQGKLECFSDEGIGTEFIIEIPLQVHDNVPGKGDVTARFTPLKCSLPV